MSFFEHIQRIEDNLAILDFMIDGGENDTLTRAGRTVTSIRKAISDSFAEVRALVQGRVTFRTQAQMFADLSHPDGTLCEVWDDADNINGLYGKVGASGSGTWQRSRYDVLNMTLTEVERAENRITDVVTDTLSQQTQSINAEVDARKVLIDNVPLAGVAYAIVDDQGNAVLTVDSAGNVAIHRYFSAANTIQKVINTPDGLLYGIADEQGNVAFEIRDTGAVRLGFTEFQTLGLMSDKNIAHAWCDELGNMVLYVTKDGEVVIPSLKIKTSASIEKTVTLANSQSIVMVGDSYTASHYTQKDKAYISNLAALSDYRFQNFAISGNDALDMAYRIANNVAYHDGKTFDDYNATYAFLLTHTNDNQFRAADLSYYQDNVDRLIQTVKAAGSQPILCSEFLGTTVDNQLLNNLAQSHQIDFVDVTTVNYEIGSLQRGPFHQGHPGTRSNGVFWLPLYDYIKNMPQPQQGIKIFRKRPNVVVSHVSDLLFDDVYQRSQLFKELSVSHYHLSDATAQHFEELDTQSVYSHVTTKDEYWQLQNGNSVSFDDYALIELILPGTANTLDSVTLNLNATFGAEVYLRSVLDSDAAMLGRAQGATPTHPEYLEKYQKPKGAWQKISMSKGQFTLDGAQLNRLLNHDKLQVLLVNSAPFNVFDVSASFTGEGGKVAYPNHRLQKLDGAELLSQTHVGTVSELADWQVTGTPKQLVPIDVYNAPRNQTLTGPVAGVVEVTSTDTISQTATLTPSDTDETHYKLMVWCRHFPKAFLDNSLYNLDTAQVIDRSQAGISYAQHSPINSDTFDLRQLQVEYSLAAETNPSGMTKMRDFTGLMWRRVEFDIRVPRSTMSKNTQYKFTLSSPDGTVQIAKVQLREIK